MILELDRRAKNPDDGWDEKAALKHWVQICGPSAITPYLFTFLENEINLREKSELSHWQKTLVKLFSYVLRFGSPMEQAQLNTFQKMLVQSRNAEEALLVAMNLCSRVIEEISDIDNSDLVAFGEWLKRILGQLEGRRDRLYLDCLSRINLGGANLVVGDFFGATLSCSNLEGIRAHLACFVLSTLQSCNLSGAQLVFANLMVANLAGANLAGANLNSANLTSANLEGANLEGANLAGANLENVFFKNKRWDKEDTEELKQLLLQGEK